MLIEYCRFKEQLEEFTGRIMAPEKAARPVRLRNKKPYDEAKYLVALKTKGPPLAAELTK